jgi:hypothetical protein
MPCRFERARLPAVPRAGGSEIGLQALRVVFPRRLKPLLFVATVAARLEAAPFQSRTRIDSIAAPLQSPLETDSIAFACQGHAQLCVTR